MVFTFDPALFRSQFPAFASVTDYPTATLQVYYNISGLYISTNDYGYLNGDGRAYALNLMTAHITAINDINAAAAENQSTSVGLVTSASVGDVSVSIQPPPTKSAFDYWLSLTPYGQQLLALLNMIGAGGLYIGGLPERSAFRKVGGIF